MTQQELTMPRNRRTQNPTIIINANDHDHLEAQAEGPMARNINLADSLLDELGRANVVTAAKMPTNIFAIGNAVMYRYQTTSMERTVILVYPEGTDIAQGKISVMNPIGVERLGLPAGASFHGDTRAEQCRTLAVIAVSLRRWENDRFCLSQIASAVV